MQKKAQVVGLEGLKGAALGFLSLAIVLGLAASVLSTIKGTQCTQYWDGMACYTNSTKEVVSTSLSVAYNATGKGLTAISDFSSWMPTMVVIMIAVVILGLIGAFLYSKRQ